MNIWQIQEAKAKLTKLIKNAQSTPQIISRRGVPETVVMSLAHYEKLSKIPYDNIVTFFHASPLFSVKLDLDRDKSNTREIEL